MCNNNNYALIILTINTTPSIHLIHLVYKNRVKQFKKNVFWSPYLSLRSFRLEISIASSHTFSSSGASGRCSAPGNFFIISITLHLVMHCFEVAMARTKLSLVVTNCCSRQMALSSHQISCLTKLKFPIFYLYTIIILLKQIVKGDIS